MIRSGRYVSHVCDAGGFPANGPLCLVDSDSIFSVLAELEKTYPGFREWYYGKVLPGVYRGERLVLAHFSDLAINGIAIAKRGSEKKLCTLWVHPNARMGRIGAALAEEAFAWMGTRTPLFTVPEERLHEFKGLLRQWSFGPSRSLRGYYGPERVEHVFNGKLVPPTCS